MQANRFGRRNQNETPTIFPPPGACYSRAPAKDHHVLLPRSLLRKRPRRAGDRRRRWARPGLCGSFTVGGRTRADRFAQGGGVRGGGPARPGSGACAMSGIRRAGVGCLWHTAPAVRSGPGCILADLDGALLYAAHVAAVYESGAILLHDGSLHCATAPTMFAGGYL